MDDKRRYQRYVVTDRETIAQSKILVEKELVKLVDFSMGGLCVISKHHFTPGVISVLVKLRDGGRIDLRGAIVRIKEEGKKWRIAIDLTETYKLNTLRKV